MTRVSSSQRGCNIGLTSCPTLEHRSTTAQFPAGSIEGEDWDSLPHKAADLVHGKRVDDARWFALIGTVDKKHPWVIVDGAVVTAPASGAFTRFFNDVQLELFYENNGGSVVLEVVEVTQR